jgi:hypothetical protein
MALTLEVFMGRRWGQWGRGWVAGLALVGVLGVPSVASAALLEKLVLDLEGPGADDAIVTFSAVDAGSGQILTELTGVLPSWLPLSGVIRLLTFLPNLPLLGSQHWAARVDARFADGPVRVKSFKIDRLLGADRVAKVPPGNLAGSCEWFLIGDEVGE